MQAAWLQDQNISIRDIPTPSNPLEALIRVRKAGVCSTDLELLKGYYPFNGVLGHEFVGEVVESPVAGWVGQRVVGEINAADGICEQCLKGRPTHCENRTVLGIVNRNGVFAEYTMLPLENLHRVPGSIPDETAVFTEPLAAALEIQQQVQIRPTDRVLLVGAGRLGQLIAQTLRLTGCDLRVIARHPSQQKLLEKFGVRMITSEDVQPRRWDVVIEATGSSEGFVLARQAVRPRGTLIMKSTYKGDLTVNLSSIVVDEITILGSRCGPFEPALRLLENHDVDPSALIAAEFSLVDGLNAIERASQPGVLKVLIQP